MVKGSETVNVRIDKDVKAAIELLIAEKQLSESINLTISQAIWYLIEKAEPSIAVRVDELKKKNQ